MPPAALALLLLQGFKKMNPFCIPFAINNMGGALLAMDLGFMGPNYSISTACATGNFCILRHGPALMGGVCHVHHGLRLGCSPLICLHTEACCVVGKFCQPAANGACVRRGTNTPKQTAGHLRRVWRRHQHHTAFCQALAEQLPQAQPGQARAWCCSAAEHIRRGEADIMLAGGADAAIIPSGIGGFIACKALSKHNSAPEQASRPWDKGRDGFVMGEGAGVSLNARAYTDVMAG